MPDPAYPYRLTASGTTARSTGHDHVRQMLEQLLFTNRGERVNHPDFGCGLLELVFEPSATSSAGLIAVLRASVQQWLGDVVEVIDAFVTTDDGLLSIELTYLVIDGGEKVTDTFQMAVPT